MSQRLGLSSVTDLSEVLVEARKRGFLGASPIQRQVEHSLGFLAVCAAISTRLREQSVAGSTVEPPETSTRLLDLGTGGGIPGLALAVASVPAIDKVVLLEGSDRRAEWLYDALESLELMSVAEVLAARAEVAGHLPRWRQGFSVVVARSFARPAVTAECAAPFLRVGGVLVVSEPPSRQVTVSTPLAGQNAAAQLIGSSAELESRWPSTGVAELGLGSPAEWRARGFRYSVLPQRSPCPERYPRRTGVPAKRPLF